MKKLIMFAMLLAPGALQAFDITAIRTMENLASALPEVPVPGEPVPAGDPYAAFDPAKRPAVMVSETAAAQRIAGIRSGLLPGSTEYHIWDTLLVRPGAIARMYWGYQPGGVGHSFLLAAFKEGGLTDSAGRDVPGLIFSLEPWYKKGEPYKPFTLGIWDHYPLIWVVSTWESFSDYELERNDGKLSIYPLKLEAGREEAMLRIALREAVKDRAGEYYHTFLRSCTNMPMDILGEAIGEDFRFFKTLPAAGVRHLKLRGLIDDGMRLSGDGWRGLDIRTGTMK